MRKFFLWKKVNVVVVVVVSLASAGGLHIGVGRVRNRGINGRKVGLNKRNVGGRWRKKGLGRRKQAPFVRRWREREGSCKAGKNERGDGFQLHDLEWRNLESRPFKSLLTGLAGALLKYYESIKLSLIPRWP